MGLTAASFATLSRFAEAIKSAPASTIESSLKSSSKSSFRDEVLGLGTEGDLSTFFAPFDHINENADVVIVGITPGVSQALEAILSMRSALLAGASINEAAQRAKQSASFKGKMRDLGARLMDHFRFNEVFGMETTLDLFGKHKDRAHYTSVLRYPFLKAYKNFSGDKKMLARPIMKTMIEKCLVPELQSLPQAWIVPFGPNAHAVLTSLAERGLIDDEKILGGLLHPSGTQWNRYRPQLEMCSREEAMSVPGGAAVLERSDALHEKVSRILGRDRTSAPRVP